MARFDKNPSYYSETFATHSNCPNHGSDLMNENSRRDQDMNSIRCYSRELPDYMREWTGRIAWHRQLHTTIMNIIISNAKHREPILKFTQKKNFLTTNINFGPSPVAAVVTVFPSLNDGFIEKLFAINILLLRLRLRKRWTDTQKIVRPNIISCFLLPLHLFLLSSQWHIVADWMVTLYCSCLAQPSERNCVCAR